MEAQLEMGSYHNSTIDNLQQLLTHPDFTLENPNRVRSLLGVFVMQNPVFFHEPEGRGYRLVCEQIIHIDNKNPQLAARLARCFLEWKRYDKNRQEKMQKCLEQFVQKESCSKDLYEIASTALKAS